MIVYQQDGGEAAYELAQKRGLLNANGDLRLTLEWIPKIPHRSPGSWKPEAFR